MTSWHPFGIASDPKSIVLVDILRRSTSGLFASHIIRCSYWNGHDVPLAVLVQLLYRLVPSTSWLQHTLMSLPSIVWSRSRTTFTSSWTILPTVTSSLKSAQLPLFGLGPTHLAYIFAAPRRRRILPFTRHLSP